MPRHCSAAGCKSRDTKESRGEGVTFHRLPKKGNPRRNAWILKSHRKGPGGKGQWEPRSDFVYFCSKHFTPDSFELAGASGYHRLKDDAVPTIVDLPSCKKSRKKGKSQKKDEDSQLSIKTKSDKDTSECQQTLIKGPNKQSPTVEKETENSAPFNENQINEHTSSPLPEDIAKKDMANDQNVAVTENPPSPSRYMRRLPPPAGFYVAKEHNYAVIYPLVWRRSYEKAIGSLQKALRLLSAARRRENRLRLTLLRLRENQFKQTLSQIQEQKKESQGRTSVVAESDKTARTYLEDNEMEDTTEEIDFLQEEVWQRAGRTAKQRVGGEDEEGYCLYCGRGKEDDYRGRTRKKMLERKRKPSGMFRKRSEAITRSMDVSDTETKSCRFFFCESEGTKVAATSLPTEQLAILQPPPEMLLQAHALSSATPPLVMPTSPIQLQQLHLLQEGQLHTEITATDSGITHTEEGGLCSVILVPVSSETKDANAISVESVIPNMETQTILVTEGTFQQEGSLDDESDLIDLQGSGFEVSHNGHPFSVRTAVVGGDVKQRLKEHLEGFQLQLSNEFID